YGYSQLNLSGGEPTLHAGFDKIVSTAIDLGMRVSVITNGWRSSLATIDRLSRCHTVAVSIDGPRTVHDHLRQRQGSFDAALRTVAELAARDQSVGIVSCVTESTMDFIPELWELAASLGAALLQFRPIAPVGRAAENDSLRLPLLDRLAVVAAALGSIGDGPRVQCDLIGTQRLLRGITSLVEEFQIGEMAQLLSPLVIDEHGSLRPYSYNLRGHDLGTIDALRDGSFRPTFERWRSAAIELHERTAAATRASDSNFVDWFELLVRVSQRSSGTPVSVQMPGL
ncbi:MAG TPA: radical SAM protein, partial [Ilumatobacter sp.]|nr:radical SAM protein [Ilumatobacter sp.]